MYAFVNLLFKLFALLNFSYFIYIVIHLLSWVRMPQSTGETNHSAKTKVSIIIPTRNEETTIIECLQAIAAQTYPADLKEVIIVNDQSIDKTKEVAEKSLAHLKINGKIICNREGVEGKKSAITEGIQNSSGEFLIITDADSRGNARWLAAIENGYQKTGAYMLCGPVQIINEKGFLGAFQSLELCGLSLLSGAGLNAGIPLLCNGANIAYTR